MFSFRGRIGRLAYFGSGMIAAAIMLTGLIGTALLVDPNAETPSLTALAPFGIAWPIAMWVSLAGAVKRCHDLGKSGWYMMLSFLIVPGLLMMFGAGDRQQNKYGFPGGKNPHAGGMSPREMHIAQFG